MNGTPSLAPAHLALLLVTLPLACAGGTDTPPCASAGCDPNATCSEEAGAAVCTCAEGYDGDGYTCVARAARAAAAAATAGSTTNACATLGAFYWEVGDGDGALASGSVTPAGSEERYDAGTVMAIASASKWLYSAYYVEQRAGVLTAEDVKFLNFTSGYSSFGTCLPGDTVDSCLARGTNGTYTPSTDGYFFYDGAHMQKHAGLNGLGALDNAGLAGEVRARLGLDLELAYSQPQPAGGVVTSAAEYASFLRKIVRGELAIAGLLGTHAVCVNPETCPTALSTPSPSGVDFHYSLGHWVEDDPDTGDGAFSSAGAFGFYPWIDADRALYGVLARKAAAGTGFESLGCGRLIRAAWKTATVQ